MSDDHQKIYETGMADFQAQLAQQVAAFNIAKANNDLPGQAVASMEVAAIRVHMREYDQLAAEVAPRDPLPEGRYMSDKDIDRAVLYLTPAEREAAKISTDYGTIEERERRYVENRAKYHQMLATGQYSRQADNRIKR